MAAFSYRYQPFLVDSSYLPNTMSSLEEPLHINTSFPPYHFHIHQEPASFSVNNNNNQETSCVDQSSKVSISDTELSVVKNQSPETSMVVDKLENGEQVTQKKVNPMEKKRRIRNGSPLSKDSTEGGSKKQKKRSVGVKDEDKQKEEKEDENEKKSPEEVPTGYIHVRARRGQATDSHSLAERVRREKISERMKILQKLVPGCDKVTGKALVLDEIINYVQSLQNQVEFLSMKLASVNPILFDLAMDIASPSQQLPSVLPCSSNQATAFTDTPPLMTTTSSLFPTASNNNDYLLDYPSPLFLQGQRSNIFLEHTGGPFWDAEDQRQKFLNPYGISNNTCSLN